MSSTIQRRHEISFEKKKKKAKAQQAVEDRRSKRIGALIQPAPASTIHFKTACCRIRTVALGGDAALPGVSQWDAVKRRSESEFDPNLKSGRESSYIEAAGAPRLYEN
ncbi:hypothetical protein EYF80_014933 [Liparis tanakae]|uniref:Uncharacterized protein n=1 Tax=Liparis tanakae TaxID=230148 RepID=A0A4Z2ICM1_9TELE|nr:hypothetical protein EYF80_014933 [Liparis tanakae]